VPRKRQRERRRPHGFGSVVKKVSRGYVVFKPKVVVDGDRPLGSKAARRIGRALAQPAAGRK
jgi:hypothetical protein